MQAIVRFSIDGDYGSGLRNKLAPVLAKYNLGQVGNTGTWKTQQDVSEANFSLLLRDFWDVVAKHKGKGKLDHFWMYSDREALVSFADQI